ncbi:MAG: phospholipid/cholesterol/gamma-HCH transport system substrate-binding protein [Acidimicrobiaceae bacterium]|jgi:phospholipid/cholesterol/gamma-HCH transport system substrate-binding protein
MSRRTLVNLVFFMFVFLIMCIWAVRNIVVIDAIDKPYTITGEFQAASGILPNAEVAYLGVHYGRVGSVSPIPGGVKMTMKLDRNKNDIPKSSTARIFRKSAIGEPYIDFQPPAGFDAKSAGPDAFLRNGDNIPVEQTQNPLEFSELLRSASRLLHAIDPQKAGSLIHELALALNGRGDSLRQLTIANDELAATFAAKTDALDRLSTNNTTLTHVLADHANDFGQSLTNLSLLAESLKNANGDTAVLLDEGSQLMGRLADLVDAEKGNLDCVLHDLADVIDVSSAGNRVERTGDLLVNGKEAFDDVFATRDQEPDGVWVRVNLLEDPTNPAPQYVPPKPLPDVPAVPACASTIGSVHHGPDFVPSQVLAATTRTSRLPELPATGGVAFLGLTGVLLAAAAAFRWVSRVDH